MYIDFHIDIETIPGGDIDDIDVKVPANYKKAETIEKYIADNREEQFARRGLDGLTGEICSIAWAFDNGTTRCVYRNNVDVLTEMQLLENFWSNVVEDLLKINDSERMMGFPSLRWCGHSVEFDMRFIKQRCMVNSIRPPYHIPADSRHGSDSVFCTMKEWAGWKGFVSLDALCDVFGFRKSALGTTGADVWPMFQVGEYDKIAAYNKDDVEATRAVFKRMTYAYEGD